MVTAELAIGILSATMVAIVLCWGIHLLAIQTECADIAAQAARAQARGDQAMLAQTHRHAPKDATFNVDATGSEVRVSVSVPESFGHVFTINITGRAVMPKEPGA